MIRMKNLQVSLVAVSLFSLATWNADAQELLLNGDFETSSVLPGWTLDRTVTDMPGAPVNSAEQQGFANQPSPMSEEFGLWLRAFSGNVGAYTDENRKTNAILSQTVAGSAGESYTFTGWSRFESNYSGGVDFLDLLSPSGEIESPTESIWEMAFLDGGGAVIGAPVDLDLRSDQIADDTWRQHTLMGTAPAGTASVRVTASATDMIFNIDPAQSGFYDNFSLTAASAPASEVLINADLNSPPPEFSGWTVTEAPEGADTIASAGFANNPSTGGENGGWLRGFANGDATLSQTVPGTPGSNYTFSLWSAWEQFYSGGMPDSSTEDFMELAFLDDAETVIDTPVTLDLLDAGQSNSPGPIGENPQAWKQFLVNGVAPAGTVSVRVSAGATGMFDSMQNPQSAFLDDLSLTVSAAGLPGDYNQNGVVDAADYTLWRDNLGQSITLPNEGAGVTAGMVTEEDYDFWKMNFGNSMAGGGAVSVTAAVPEPAGWVLAIISLACAGFNRRCPTPWARFC